MWPNLAKSPQLIGKHIKRGMAKDAEIGTITRLANRLPQGVFIIPELS